MCISATSIFHQRNDNKHQENSIDLTVEKKKTERQIYVHAGTLQSTGTLYIHNNPLHIECQYIIVNL